MSGDNATSVKVWQFCVALILSPIILLFWFGVLMGWSAMWVFFSPGLLIGALLDRCSIDAALSPTTP